MASSFFERMNHDPATAETSPANPPAGRVRPLDWARAADAGDLVGLEMNACLRRRRRRAAVTAGALLAVLTAGGIWQVKELAPEAAVSTNRAILSHPARQTLPDGSIVELKDDAQIAVHYTGAERRVTLARGEAHFQVAKNPDRPFVVTAQGVDVRAVGTAFSVQLDRSSIEVLVTEGQVAVEASAGAEPPAGGPRSPGASRPMPVVLVAAGNRVSLDLTWSAGTPPPVLSVPAAELVERLAWRVPRLELNFTPLAEVLPMINQYGGTRLTLAHPEVGRLKLSGSLRADNVPVFLQILESSYGVKADHRSAGEIILSRAP